MVDVLSSAMLDSCAAVLRRGGIVAYPTEAVYGLGCDPHNAEAVTRLLALKQRSPEQGLLLIGANFEQLEPWLDLAATPIAALQRAQETWPGAHTWIFPRAAGVPDWLAGAHPGIGVRVTAHPAAAALCRTFSGALVSTSANRHGMAPARSADDVRAMFDNDIGILDGLVGNLERPTPIHDALTGHVVRS